MVSGGEGKYNPRWWGSGWVCEWVGGREVDRCWGREVGVWAVGGGGECDVTTPKPSPHPPDATLVTSRNKKTFLRFELNTNE